MFCGIFVNKDVNSDNNLPGIFKRFVYCLKHSSLFNDPSAALQVAKPTLHRHSLVKSIQS